MMIETLPTVQLCRYCGGSMRPGLAEDARLILCGPSVRIGFLCDACGQLEAPFLRKEMRLSLRQEAGCTVDSHCEDY